MINCSSALLMGIVLILVYLITTSRKNNFCVMISLMIAIAVSWIFYAIISSFDFTREFALRFSAIFSHFSSLPSDENHLCSFVYGFWMYIVFVIVFSLSVILSAKLIRIGNYFSRKNKHYYVLKSIYVFLNTLMAIYALLFFIADFNIIYNMPGSFLKFLFDIAQEGIYRL